MHIPLHEDAKEINNRPKLLCAGGILLAPSSPLIQIQGGDVRELHALTNLLAGLHGPKMVFPGQVQWELKIIMRESGERLCLGRRWENGAGPSHRQRDHVDEQALHAGRMNNPPAQPAPHRRLPRPKPWRNLPPLGGSDALIGQGPHLEHIHHLQVLLLQRSAQLAQQLVLRAGLV